MAVADTISVVIPTKNRRTLLQRAVRSVLAQEGVEVQLVVVDDGSTDQSAEAILALGHDRVQVVSLPTSGGVGAARNAGVARADGRWLAFLDDDDVWAPEKLARQMARLAADHTHWCYAGAVMVDEQLEILHAPSPDLPEDIVAGLPVRNRLPAGSSNIVVDRQVVVDLGGFDTTLRFHEDWDLWIRLWQQAGTPSCVVEPLVAFTLHEQNVTLAATDRSRVDGLFADLAIIEQRYAHLRGDQSVDRAMVWRWLASQYVRSGRRGAGVRAALRAAALAPGEALRWVGGAASSEDGASRDYLRQAETWIQLERSRTQGAAST